MMCCLLLLRRFNAQYESSIFRPLPSPPPPLQGIDDDIGLATAADKDKEDDVDEVSREGIIKNEIDLYFRIKFGSIGEKVHEWEAVGHFWNEQEQKDRLPIMRKLAKKTPVSPGLFCLLREALFRIWKPL